VLRELEASVVVEEVPSPDRFANLTVTLDDGATAEETVTSVGGDPDRPIMSVEAGPKPKVRRFAAPLGAARAAAIVDLLMRGDSASLADAVLVRD
jgi:hypothetical protein